MVKSALINNPKTSIFIQLADATASLANKRGINIGLYLLRHPDDTADILRDTLVSMHVHAWL